MAARLSGGRLDGNRVACHHGRRSAQWLRGRAMRGASGGTARCRIPGARPAGVRIHAPFRLNPTFETTSGRLFGTVIPPCPGKALALSTLLLFCFLIGCVAGLRSLTAPAVTCWGAHLGWLHFAGTRLAFIGHCWMLILFTLLALFELVNDKLPKTPARTAAPGLIARILFGGLCGAALAVSAGANLWVAVIVAVIGALVGTFGGYNIRHCPGHEGPPARSWGGTGGGRCRNRGQLVHRFPPLDRIVPARGCRNHRNSGVRGTQ